MTDKEKKIAAHPFLSEFLFGLKRFLKNPLSIIGLAIILTFTAIAIFAPVIAPPENPEKPFEMPHDGWKTAPSPPSEKHIFGTLPMQYDIFYGVVWGTRSAFQVGLFVVLINLVTGLILGSLAGYFGGLVDEIIMRVADIFYAIPFLVIAMFLVIVFGKGIGAIVAVLIILGWPTYTRVVRSEILVVRNADYIHAARASGASHFRILLQHVIPNSVYSVIVVASMRIGTTVLSAAALSFLGLGAGSEYADWGQMVATCRNYIVGPSTDRLKYWYVVFIPGFVIAMFVLGWNLLGDAIRDVFDPKQRRK